MVSNIAACGVVADVLRKFGEVRIRVFGTSMMPALNPGDSIFIRRAAIEEVTPKNIVLFLRDGRLFAHRVVEKLSGPGREDLRLITRGDRLQQNDPPICQSELLGRVMWAERHGNRIDPNKPLSFLNRAIAPILQASERATYVYMRFFDLQRSILFGEAVRKI
jgi:signal peptidase I